MNRFISSLFFVFIGAGALVFVLAPVLVNTGFFTQAASVFFIESSKPENLQKAFAEVPVTARKLRILVVPGHDEEYWGSQFDGVKEGTMTLELGKKLAALLAQDKEFDVTLARDNSGYNPILASYFAEHSEEILAFTAQKKKIMSNLEDVGQVSIQTEKVFHNNAPSPVVVRLYGINKWANENNIDLVAHVHFNDYPRKKKTTAGQYSGFSIYVPEHQYSNARASKAVADAVSKQLQTYYPPSNMPKENGGVVEDQDLIAIGSFNTLDPASILVEYGYIYEPQFLEGTIRSKVMEDLATQTYIGIHNFFNNTAPLTVSRFRTALLPHVWFETVAAGAQHNPSILSLQAALTLEGVYPPQGSDSHACPLAGTYGGCTKKAVALFQKKHGLPADPNRLSDQTRAKLNELYGY